MADLLLGIRISAEGGPQTVKEIRAIDKAVKDLQTQNERVANTAKALQDAYERVANTAKALQDAYDLSDADVDQLIKQLKQLENQTKSTESELTALGIAIKTKLVDVALQALQALGAAISETLGAALAENADFEQASAAAATLVDDVDALTSALGEQQQRLGGQVTTNELLAASYDVLSAGFTEAGLAAEITGESARGAIAGFSEVGTVTDAVTTILNSYSDANLSAAQVVDQLVQTQNLGKITVDQYAQSIGRAASIASTAGVGFDELNAAVAAATAAGVAPESAIAGVNQAIQNLLKPTADGAELLKQFGIENAAAKLEAEGLDSVLQQISQNDPTTQQLSQIFSSTEALAVIAPIAGGNIGRFNDALAGIAGASGTTDQNLEKLTQTIPALQTRLQTLISEGLLKFGQAIAPITAGVLEFSNAVLSATAEGFDGFDQLTAAGERLNAVLNSNPEIAEQLGAALATVANKGVEQLGLIIDAVTALLANEDAVDAFGAGIEQLAANLALLGGTARFLIALVDGLASVVAYIVEIPVLGEVFLGLANPIQFVISKLDEFRDLFDLAFESAADDLERLANRLENIPGLGRFADDARNTAESLRGFESSAERAASKAEETAQRIETAAKNTPDPLEKPAETSQQNAAVIETAAEDAASAAETISDKYSELAQSSDLATQQLIADRLEQGASAEEIEGIEAKALNDRIALNQQKLAELKAINADALSADEQKALAAEIASTEADLADARVETAQATRDAQIKAAEEARDAAIEAAKAQGDALEDAREQAERLAEQQFDDASTNRERQFDDAAQTREQAFEADIQAQKEAGQQRIEAIKQASQDSLQRQSEAFQQRQQREKEAFEKGLQDELDAGNRLIDAAASEAEFQTALRLEGDDAARADLIAERERAKERAEILAEEQEKALRSVNQSDVPDLTPVEQARIDLETQIEAKRAAFEEQQRTEALAFEEQQQAQERANEAAIAELERQLQDELNAKQQAFDESERELDRAFKDAELDKERAFKEQQRQLDIATAEQVRAILASAEAANPIPRFTGGPLSKGGLYSVAEKGPELARIGGQEVLFNRPSLITPQASGYVYNASQTARKLSYRNSGSEVDSLRREIRALHETVRTRSPVQSRDTYVLNTQTPTQDAGKIAAGKLRNMARMKGM